MLVLHSIALGWFEGVSFQAADAVEDIKTVILALQPVVLVLIGAIAYEDGQAMKAEATSAASKPQA